jgi:hypothetical protein
VSSPRIHGLSWGDSLGPEVDDREAGAVERHALAVADRRVREDAPARPLVPEHRSHDRFLLRVVADDRVDDALGRDDRNVVAGHELRETRVVVGMRVGEKHRLQRLAEPLEPAAHRGAVRDRQERVDGDDAGRRLDEVRVDERALLVGGEPVNDRSHGVFPSVG